jgi:hypothetical protein
MGRGIKSNHPFRIDQRTLCEVRTLRTTLALPRGPLLQAFSRDLHAVDVGSYGEADGLVFGR